MIFVFSCLCVPTHSLPPSNLNHQPWKRSAAIHAVPIVIALLENDHSIVAPFSKNTKKELVENNSFLKKIPLGSHQRR